MKKLTITSAIALACLTTSIAQETPPSTNPPVQFNDLQINLGDSIGVPIVRVEFTVTNTSEHETDATVIVYYQGPDFPFYKPLGKSDFKSIPPGSTFNAKVILEQYNLAIGSRWKNKRVLQKGQHRIKVRSSNNLVNLDATFDIAETTVFKYNKGFNGKVIAKWVDDRDMLLIESLTYTDSSGRRWKAPQGARLNGASIPRSLWATIGAPFVGNYRRASVVHDYYVGENGNPRPADPKVYREADRMFFEACLNDGCDVEFASKLYAGVRFGSWKRLTNNKLKVQKNILNLNLKPEKQDQEELNLFQKNSKVYTTPSKKVI